MLFADDEASPYHITMTFVITLAAASVIGGFIGAAITGSVKLILIYMNNVRLDRKEENDRQQKNFEDYKTLTFKVVDLTKENAIAITTGNKVLENSVDRLSAIENSLAEFRNNHTLQIK